MTVPADELRAWAEGDYPTEAAVEILIRAKGGRFALASCPWIEPLGPSPSLYRVDWDRLHEESGLYSGGERRFLNIATSLGSPDHPVDLSNNLSGLDDELLLLMLAATAHAAGRPRLLAPASAAVTSPSGDETEQAQSSPRRHADPTHTSSRTPGSAHPTDPHHTRSVRRPDDALRADQASLERHDGPRP